MSGCLYVVSTPIGNLEDITYRAVRVLATADLIACEDTRHTRKLLAHYGINTKTISYHEHNERERAAELLTWLQSGSDVAIVSDAGTPLINDPGFRLVRLAADSGLNVVPVPGPSALISALVVAALPCDQFFFGGFLPARSVARRARLDDLRQLPATLVFYEAPHRIASSLKDARETLGEREAVVARELTKIHEEVVRGLLSELVQRFSHAETARGEMVLIIDHKLIANGDTEKLSPRSSVATLVATFEQQGIDQRAALKRAARELGLSRAEAYRRLVAERSLKQAKR